MEAIEKSGFLGLEENLERITIIHGNELGVDKLADRFAVANKIPVKHVFAKWEQHGKSAGPIRNEEMVGMALNADIGAMLAIWDGYSNGTFDCIRKAHKAGLAVHVHMPDVVRCGLAEAKRISENFQKI